MGRAASPRPSERLPSEAARRDRGYRPVLVGYVLLASLFAGCSFWLFAHGYRNEAAIRSWTQILGILDAPHTRLEYLTLAYPHLPLYLLIPFRYVPGLDTPLAPAFLAALLGSGLLACWYQQLGRGLGQPYRLLAVGALLGNPLILWSLTTSGTHAIALVLVYVLCLAIAHLATAGEIRSFMMVGCTLALLFFADERTPYLVVAFVPLLPLLLPTGILRRGAVSAYLAVFQPVVFAVLGWSYLNWMFFQDPWHWLLVPESAFRGAWAEIGTHPWLRDHGGQLITPLVLSAVFAVILSPWLVWLLGCLGFNTPEWRACFVMTALPVIATALATADSFLPHPLLMLFLLVPAMMAGVVLWPQGAKRQRVLLIAILGMSTVLSWGSVFWFSSPDFANWAAALRGRTVPPTRVADARLGAWLGVHRDPTLLDGRLAAWVVAARGDAHGLRLPFTREFRLNLLDQLAAPQVAVPDPTIGLGASDRLNQRYPKLYGQGWPGYTLVYDDPPWRVYRRDLERSRPI